MSQPLIIICGLPRSGTTSVFSFIRDRFDSCTSYPDECHMLGNDKLLKSFSDLIGAFYDSHLIDVPKTGYSAYGKKNTYIDNFFYMLFATNNIINFRYVFEQSTLSEEYIDEQKKHLSKPISELIKTPLILKKPFSEKNIPFFTEIFKNRKLVFVYCFRDIESVMTSNISKLQWYSDKLFIKTATTSFKIMIDNINNQDLNFVPINPSFLNDPSYVEQFLQQVSNQLPVKFKNFEANLGLDINANAVKHSSSSESRKWTMEKIAQVEGGEECLQYYEKIKQIHDQIYGI